MLKSFEPLRQYFIKNQWYLAAGFMSIIIVDILQLIIPRIIKRVIDCLAGGLTSEGALLRYALLIIITALLIAVFRFAWRYCIIGTSRRIERGLRNHLFAHIIRLPLSSLIQTKTGDLMARMTNDLEAVRMCTGIGLVALIDTVFLGIASVSFMLYISPALTFFCLSPMILIVFTTWRLSRLLHLRFSRVQAAFSTLTEKVRETIAGITVIKAYVREKQTADDFKTISQDYIRKNLSLVKIWGLLFPLIIFFTNLSIGMLIFFGGRLTIENNITPGDFVAFASYLWIITWPMIALGWVVNLFQRGSASMVRLNDVLNMDTEVFIRTDKVNFPETRGCIEIRNLTFSYSGAGESVLNNISLSIRAGETIGITGKTGSGKTTLCNLLHRFFNPPGGTIFFDNVDICDLPLKKLRSSIAYVPQDSFLFSDTIHENISFGKHNARPEQIHECAQAAQIMDEIMDFEVDFNTMIGERGVTLSGGQKQRLCIARALLIPAPILMLDDTLSSLDVATTRKIVATLRTAKTKRTSIIVSNRIETIKHADKIFVFDDGLIIESGKHKELIDKGGLYYNLYLRQQLESET